MAGAADDPVRSVPSLADDFVARPGAALVTGGSGGIGEAVCGMLAARGSHVAFTWRANADAADRVARELGESGRRVSSHQAQLTDEVAVAALLVDVRELHGGIHTLVHCAG